MRKKKSKIVFAILMILVLIAGSLLSQYRESIQSILRGIRAGEGEIQKLRDENQAKLVEDVNEYMEKPLREMTAEEKEQIASGKTTVNEIYQKMFEEKIKETEGKESEKPQTNGEKTPDEKGETGNKVPGKEEGKPQGGNASENTAPSTPTKDLLVSQAMVDLYALQTQFNARAEATIIDGGNYYMSIRKHPQDAEARAQTISYFTPTVRGIESECDAKVEEIILQLESDLKSIGADTSICATIRTTYANEKQLKLSYYTNKYLK